MATRTRPFQRILVPTDLGPGAERAIVRVPLLPFAENARIVLLHCVPDQAATLRSTRVGLEKAAADLERSCRDRGARVHVKPVLARGVPFRTILEQGGALNSELIVLGRHRRRPVADWLGIGTTVERVVRGATVPVLMVRRPPRRPYDSLLVALDRPPAPPAERAVDAALRLVPEPERAFALHATHHEYSDTALGRPGLPPSKIAAWRAARRSEAASDVGTWLQKRYPDNTWALLVTTAEPIHSILKAATGQRVDLIALGTHSRTAVESWLLGSVAESVLRSADCDVLVVSET